MAVNPIVAEIEADLREGATAGLGAIGKIAAGYNNSSLRLLGFLLSLSYEEMRIVTCDPWKRKCGGVPRNSFVIVKVNPNAAGPDDAILANRLILGRVTESVPTPVETDIQSTIFQVHKVQAIVDPLESLFESVFAHPPNYVRDVLEWEPAEPASIPSVQADPSRFNREWRELGIWWSVLDAAGYHRPADTGPYRSVQVPLRKEVKEALAADPNIPTGIRVDNTKSPPQIMSQQPLSALRWIYRLVGVLYDANAGMFPDSGNGPYFSKGAQSMLRIHVGAGISGTTYFTPFALYHDLQGSNVFNDIVQHLEAGTSVFVDYSNAPEGVAQNLSERIAQNVFRRMVENFSTGALADHYVIMYFEEAHQLFRSDDKDLSSIYNRLAKEGAKFHIGMVYATQSMTTLSPDLLKNTENFIIAHLNDDREVREVTRRYEFRDVAEDVQRIRSRGFVRMITLSHRFALPVQFRKFEARPS